MTKIIVGVEPSARSGDAVAFARRIAEASGARITLAGAYPYQDHPSRAANHAYRNYLRDEAQTTLDRLRDGVEGVGDVATVAIADVSPARALQGLAEREAADLIVLGSSHRGKLGRVFAGTTAERLLHGAPCPVAVIPHGSDEADSPIATIAVGHDGSTEAGEALAAAIATARAVGAGLRVVRVFSAAAYGMPADSFGVGSVMPAEDLRGFAQATLDATMADLPADVEAEPVLVTGDPVSDLIDASKRADLLFLGSRGYGPHRAVLLGSVSGRVICEAECPVIVVPRGVRAPLGALFIDEARSSTAS